MLPLTSHCQFLSSQTRVTTGYQATEHIVWTRKDATTTTSTDRLSYVLDGLIPLFSRSVAATYHSASCVRSVTSSTTAGMPHWREGLSGRGMYFCVSHSYPLSRKSWSLACVPLSSSSITINMPVGSGLAIGNSCSKSEDSDEEARGGEQCGV